MQIALGVAIAPIAGVSAVLEPDIFFLLFLPPLLFLDGWRIPKEGLFRDKGVIQELALGLVVTTDLPLPAVPNDRRRDVSALNSKDRPNGDQVERLGTDAPTGGSLPICAKTKRQHRG